MIDGQMSDELGGAPEGSQMGGQGMVNINDIALWGMDGQTPSVQQAMPAVPEESRKNQEAERERALGTLHAVWLYDDDENARRTVDEDGEFFMYSNPSIRHNEEDLYVYGKDYAHVAAPWAEDEPLSLCEQYLGTIKEPVRKEAWRKELETLKASGRDTKRDYYALLAKLVRDDVRRRHKEWKEENRRWEETKRKNEARYEELVDLGLDGKADTFTPEDIDLLQQSGLTLQDMQLLGELYKHAEYDRSQGGVHSINEEMNLAYMALKLERSGKERRLTNILMQRIARDAESRRAAVEESGFWEKTGTVLGNAGKAVGKTLMTVQSSLEPTPQGKRAAYDFDLRMMQQTYGIDEKAAKAYIEKGKALSGGMRVAREQGEAAVRELYGMSVFSVASTIGDLGSFLVQMSNPAMAYAWFADSVDDKYRQYEYVDPDGGQGGHFTRALGYTAGEYAAFKYAPKMVWSGAGNLFGATAGKLGGGAVGRWAGQGMAWMNRSALGAATMGAVRGVGDVGVIIPGATGALHTLYDVVPGTDATLDSGLKELEGLWNQLGKGSYWAETAISGGAFGLMNVPSWRKSQGLAKAQMRENFEQLGGDPAFFEKNKGTVAQDLGKVLRDELERERKEDTEGMLGRAIAVARKQLDDLHVKQERGDNAVLAVLSARGYEVVPEDGKYRLYYNGTVDGGKAVRGEKSVLLSEEDLDAFIFLQMDNAAKSAAYGMREAVAKGRMSEALKGLGVDVEWMRAGLRAEDIKAAAERARERVELRTREIVAEGRFTETEARKRAEAEVHEDVLDAKTSGWIGNAEGKTPTLKEIISFGEQWRHREGQGEAAGVRAVSTNAFVTTYRREDGTLKRVLRIALGASPKEIAEELGEQAALRFMRDNEVNSVQAFRLLNALREWMQGHEDKGIAKVADTFLTLHRSDAELYNRIVSDNFDPTDIHSLTVAEDARIRAEVVEGMSRLMFSDLMRDVLTDNPEMPGWARSLGGDLVLDMADWLPQIALAKAFMEARAQGWLTKAVERVTGLDPDAARKMVSEGAEAVRASLRGKNEPEPGEYLDAMYRMTRAQDELDARLGEGVAVAPETFDAFEQEAREGQKKLDEARTREEEVLTEKAAGEVAETEEENPGMSHEEAVKSTNEKKNDRRLEQIAASADVEADDAFAGGMCQTVDDPDGGTRCKLGFLPIDRLEVMKNFKLGSDADTGVVEPLTGDYRADHDPIRVWRRGDGTLMVISGRHRLDAAKRAGMDKIISYVYDESGSRNEQWARRFDIESNIRDNQATALEVALYVRGEWNDGRALTDEEIARAGIARKGKAGSIGCEIARKGAQSVIDAWRNGELTEQQAFWIASFMPGNERAQNAGVKMATSGDVTKGEILNTMEAAHAISQMGEELGVRAEVDLWGNEIGFGDEFEQFVGKYVTRKRNEIGKDMAYIGATATKRNAAEMAKKYGVDVKDPEAMKRKRDELAQLQQRWKYPYTDPELMEEIREAYRKETQVGLTEAEVEDDGTQAPVELPGEAEGQGTFFFRGDSPTELVWRSRMLALRQQERGVDAWRVDAHFSVNPQVGAAYLKSAERKAFSRAFKVFRSARERFNSEGFALRNSRREYDKLNWYDGAKRWAGEREWVGKFTVRYEKAKSDFESACRAVEDTCAKAFERMVKECLPPNWDNLAYADKAALLKQLYENGTLTYDEHWAFTGVLLDREEALEAARARGEAPEAGIVAAESSFSMRGQGVDYVTDKDGNAIPINDLVERVHRENKGRLAELEKDPRYSEVMGKIKDAIAGRITKAFEYRDLNESEVGFFRDRLGFDLSGYAWQFSPKDLKAVLKQKKRGKYSFALTEDELGLIPAMIDDIAGSDTATVSSNVDAITPGGTVFVKVYNPLTKMEMDFKLAPRGRMRKRYSEPEEKKKPKLTLTSARAFLGQGAGLAPAQPPKPVPPDRADSTTDGGSVKENLLRQEFTSQNTSINKVKTPAVFEMVKKYVGWAKDTLNIDIGGGKYDTLTKALQEVGVTSYIYEPYGRTSNANAYILSQLQSGNMRGDTATCSNVLNVIKESDVRANVIHQMAKAIKPGGTAYFTIYEGDGKGVGKQSKNDCWQNNRIAESYEDEVRRYFGDVSMKGKLIIAKKPLGQDTPAQWRRGGDSDEVVNFSVVGEHAANWEELSKSGRVFTGADGKKRVELDASKARVVYPVSLRKFVIDKLSAWMGTDKAKALYKAWVDVAFDLDKESEEKVADKAYRDYIAEGIDSTGLKLSHEDKEKVAPYISYASGSRNWKEAIGLLAAGDKEVGHLLKHHVVSLGEVLDFPELYNAYPDLKDMPVGLNMILPGFKGGLARYKDGTLSIQVSDKHADNESVRSTLLHEVQHAIQLIEGFTGGSAPERTGSMRDYLLTGGEIEARVVQQRKDMSAEERARLPFEEHYQRELQLTTSGWMRNGETSFSIFGMTARGASVAEERGETYVDPADGMKKWVVSDAVSRLRDNFTFGRLNVPAGGHKDTTLGSILYFPALFENYPDLETVRVRFYKPKKPDGCGGYLNPEPGGGAAAYIAVNIGAGRTPGQVLQTLRHESQHWIQSAEGHAVGSGVSSLEDALVYLDVAIKQRRDAGVDDDWSRDNLAFLEGLRARVASGDEQAVGETYLYSHGEQEARYTGAGLGADGTAPMLGGVDGEKPSHYTIAITRGATELGGVTFAGMGRFGYLLETRLLPSLEFTHDRQVMQMKETVVRMMNQLNMLPEGQAEGLKLAADGLNVMERLTSLLPNTYRMALEPYRLYFTYYSILHGTGDAEYAGGVIPMAGWDKRMTGAMRNMAMQLLDGDEYGNVWFRDFSYWLAHPELLEEVKSLLDEVRPDWEEAQKVAKEDIDDDGSSKAERSKKVRDRAIFIFSQAHPEFFETVYKALGEIRADKLMDKFLQRVALQLDHFRKDRTLGKMRRVVDSVQVLPGKDGKPRKGMMQADDYRHLQDLVALLEMTRSEREDFLELYDGEHEGLRPWDEIETDEVVPVEVYNAEGRKKTISVSKQEFDVYSSYEQMSASQAEACSRALGEFITTGRQAWQNMEEAAKARIGRMCAPLLEGFTETENERRARDMEKMQNFGQMKVSFILNDAQFFEVVSTDADCREWAGDFTRRIADGHANMEQWEKERAAFTWEAICRAAGTNDRGKVRDWLDDAKRTKKSGVVLVPREPDFEAEALVEVRRQLFGLLHRKTRQKNFSPNKFAAVIEWLSTREDNVVPAALRDELVHKYGRIGDSQKSVLRGSDAAASLFTPAEFEKFKDVGATVKARAEHARGKWREKNDEKVQKMAELTEAGEQLELSRMEAAYRVLLCEQGDYKEMMALQGYDDAAVEMLRAFAGKDVMKLAYELRGKLGERTPQMKALYEKMYGVPFPEVENYFRAYFDVGHESRENKLLGGEGFGNAAGGGKVKVLYTRRKHNAKVDSTMDVLNAFECAMKEQDTLFAWGQLGRDIKRVLNHRQNGLSMKKALEERLGSGMVQEMERWSDMFERVSVQYEEFARSMSMGKLVRAAGSASAVSILNGRAGSLVKQLTAIFNTLAGSDLVSVWEWHNAMGRFTSGVGKISMKEMAARPELAGRFKGWEAAMNKEAYLEKPDVKVGHGATAPWTRAGMSAMEWLDVKANVVSSCVLYDAVYRKLQKADKGMSHEELDAAAMGEVRRALALKSQPLDFRSRGMLASKQSFLTAGMLFLGGESINTLGNIYRLGATKRYGRMAAVWLEHGAMLQVLTYLYNWLTDDKEQWERRHWWHYAEQTVLGPLMGVPIVSQAISQGIGALSTVLPKEARPWLPTQSLLPVGDVSRSFGELKKAFFGNKPSSWQDKCIAAEQALLSLLAIGAVLYRNPKNPRDGLIKGGLYGATLILNSLDFLLRGERAFEERALER